MKTSEKKKKEQRGSRAGRSGWLFGAVATLGVVGLLALIGSAGAAVPAAAYLRAPYFTAQPVQTASALVTGAGTIGVNVLPTFSTWTGVARGEATSLIAKSTPGTSSAVYVATLGLNGLAFTTGAARTYQLVVGWSLSYRAILQAQSAGIPGQPGLVAQVGLWATTYLVEPTTGQAIAGTTTTVAVWGHSIMSGQFAFAQALQPLQIPVKPVALAASHTYTVYAAIEFVAASYAMPGAPVGSLVSTGFSLDAPTTTLTFVSVA